MKHCPIYALVLLIIVAAAPAIAQDPPASPLHLSVTKPLTPVKDILASLSQQSGTTILADDTVVDALGVGTIDKPTVPEMLDAIKALLPALSWQRIEIPSDAPVPDADRLSAEVRELQALKEDRVTITDARWWSFGDYSRLTMNYSRTATNTGKTADPSNRTVYLVTNETVRAQQAANKQAEAVQEFEIGKQKMAAAMIPNCQLGMGMVFGLYSQLTPDEQRSELPGLIREWQKMVRATDPAVLQKLQKSFSDSVGGTPFSLFPPPASPSR